MTPKPIAYDCNGEVFHVDCFYAHSDALYAHRKVRAWLGSVYYPGAHKTHLKGMTCKHCGKDFKPITQ